MKLRNRHYLLFMTTALAIALTGCFGGSSSEEEGTKEGSSINNPFEALTAIGELANKAKGLQAELEDMQPVEPVHYKVLIEALPDGLSGFSAEDPKGSTSEMGNFKISTASRRYTSDGKSIDITISDYAFNKALYVPFSMMAMLSQESTEGYNKGITIGEDPGREEYKTDSKRGERQVLYLKRYHCAVKGNGIEPEELEAWYNAIKKDTLPKE